MFYDLSARRPELEEMDKPDIDPAELEGALRSLARINFVGNSAAIFWPPIRALIREKQPPEPLRVLDVGCGLGDMSWRLEQRARRDGLDIQVDGCDLSPVAIALAQKEQRAAGKFFVHDAVSDEMPGGYDVIISSLFLHHLSNADAATVLKRMGAQAKDLVLVSDLRRSRLGLFLVYLATWTLSRSRVVHSDGVTSLRAAFRETEVRQLAEDAGLSGARFHRRWPERFLMEWRRNF